MTRPMIYTYDANTGKEETREMNDAEYAQSLIDRANYEAELAKEPTE